MGPSRGRVSRGPPGPPGPPAPSRKSVRKVGSSVPTRGSGPTYEKKSGGGSSGRGDLLSQIQKGKKLKKSPKRSPSSPKNSDKNEGGGVIGLRFDGERSQDLAAILAQKFANVH